MLHPNIRGNRATLYLDGHFSRYSPLAFWLLTSNNVEAIIFPPMVTHFMQPFDFAIAFTLKSTYDRTLRRLKYAVKRDNFNSECLDAISLYSSFHGLLELNHQFHHRQEILQSNRNRSLCTRNTFNV